MLFPSEPQVLDDSMDLVGVRGGRFFLRDRDDEFRFYPGGRLRTDFYGTFGPGVTNVSATAGGSGLKPQFVVRRVRLELSGEMLKRLSFTMGMEIGGQRIGETDLTSEAPRSAAATADPSSILPAEVSLTYGYRPWLNLTIGQFNAPFSMSNRTREYATPLMERPLPIRGLAVPYNKELGFTLWGELDRRVFAYELGVFSGDGPTRPAVDARVDFIGRLFARPLARSGKSAFFRLAQVGMSARHGERDQSYVGYDYPSIATGQGYVLWLPGYIDSHGRLTHVIPSGAQNAIGGELRLPFDLPGGRALELRGEIYYVHNNTREAVDGYQLTNTERFGLMEGVGYYGLMSAWVWGDAFASGEPGLIRPPTIDFEQDQPIPRGLEIVGIVAGLVSNYSGATREGSVADLNTPRKNIALYQFGGALQYWYGTIFRATVNYMAYYGPNSGDPQRNQAVMPSNLVTDDAGVPGDGHVMHELSTRLAITF